MKGTIFCDVKGTMQKMSPHAALVVSLVVLKLSVLYYDVQTYHSVDLKQ